ncbi:tetratricopeptide repeat protein [Vibrio nitrifigilis]|uniref:Sel1 repeat family protein n=1 Tax=Vibrio nitrifigilis TaxID=2789781 RepID=A0ABS0GLZ6_9VIBR|nr:tetratricopeptide repeat protein [Vibrio nitrifigilis]MBF9003471.1 sel1 repeat family protein [Vibrio nitrifigilis]
MNTIGIAIGVLGVSLILIFVWMITLSMRRRRMEAEKVAKEEAYRKALQRMRDQEHKERLFKAESGHVPTMLHLAKEAERKNYKEALFWYEKAALMDNLNGMYGLVRICRRMQEDLILREKLKFWELYIKAIEGDTHAKLEAGKLLVYGRGTEINVTKGLQLIHAAAENRLIEAMIFLGDWATSKDNISQSPSDSTYWYYKAAKLDDKVGMMKLGLNYLHGIGVSIEHRKACYWLERSAEQGNAEAMYYAGDAWMDYGVNGNAISYIWLFLSAYFGFEPAAVLRDNVGTKIGVDSVVGLQSLAKPLQKKISTNSVHKHSIIRALNKLYKRPIPIPHKGEEVDDGEIVEAPSRDVIEELEDNVEVPFEPTDEAELVPEKAKPQSQVSPAPSPDLGHYEEHFEPAPKISLDYTQKRF